MYKFFIFIILFGFFSFASCEENLPSKSLDFAELDNLLDRLTLIYLKDLDLDDFSNDMSKYPLYWFRPIKHDLYGYYPSEDAFFFYYLGCYNTCIQLRSVIEYKAMQD